MSDSNSYRQTWGSRLTFILAAIGSSVGLGNAWRFPGLAAKHGGGAFLLVYLLFCVIMGIPLLMMEISIGRKTKRGAPEALRAINKKLEPVGWAATANAFVIAVYYAVVFAWVILMAIISYKFAGMTGDNAGASGLWAKTIKTTGNFTGFGTIAPLVVICLLIAWISIFFCIKDGASSVGRVVKYTVFLPELCLLIMAVKGLTMPGAMEGIRVLFVPDFSALKDPTLWVDAAGQVFYSISVMMAIMIAYGSFLKEDANIAVDSLFIVGADFLTSILSGIVLFTTMYGVGMTTGDMSASGIGTAFMIYPTAIVNLTNSGIFNAVFAFIFYFCLITLAIDSAFSLIEGVSVAFADKFKFNKKKTTLTTCIVACVLSLIMTTGAGLAILDVVDHWCNYYNLIIIGILESIGIGWSINTAKIVKEINRNTDKFKMPHWLFDVSCRFVSPAILIGLMVWSVVDLVKAGGIYGAADGYTLSSNIIFGWAITIIVFASGFIIRMIVKAKAKKGFEETDTSWDD